MPLKLCFITIFICFAFGLAASPVDTSNTKDSKFKNPVVDFTLKDTTGNMVSLHDYIGKFVVISMGAGWCYHCMEEAAPTRELQKYFAGRNDIVWLFIDFDVDNRSWADARRKENVKGIQLWGRPARADLKKLFDFNELPYFIWIDKEGKVAKRNAPRPSEGAVRSELKFYLKQSKRKAPLSKSIADQK